jgi:hypothetical protein
MILFPFFYALQWQRVICFVRALRVHSDNDQRQNHFFQVDLVGRPKSLDEMRRGINVVKASPRNAPISSNNLE